MISLVIGTFCCFPLASRPQIWVYPIMNKTRHLRPIGSMHDSHTYGPKGISDIHHPTILRSYYGQTRPQFEGRLEMDDTFYCLSYMEFAFLLATMTVNTLTLVIMCFLTKKQCAKDGFLP